MSTQIKITFIGNTILEAIKRKRKIKKCQITLDHLESQKMTTIQEVLYRCDYIEKLKVDSKLTSIIDLVPDRNSILTTYTRMHSLDLSLSIVNETDLLIFQYFNESLRGSLKNISLRLTKLAQKLLVPFLVQISKLDFIQGLELKMGISYSKEKFQKLLLTKTLSKLKSLKVLSLKLSLINLEYEDMFQIDIASLIASLKSLVRLELPFEQLQSQNPTTQAIMIQSMTSLWTLQKLQIHLQLFTNCSEKLDIVSMLGYKFWNLKELFIISDSQNDIYFINALIMASLKTLKALSIDSLEVCDPGIFKDFVGILRRVRQIETLQINFDKSTAYYELEILTLLKSINKKNPWMKEISLSYPKTLQPQQALNLFHYITKFSNLKILSIELLITHISTQFWKSFEQFLRNMSNLEELTLKFNTQGSCSSELGNISDIFKQLKKLDLSFPKIQPKSIEYFKVFNRGLESKKLHSFRIQLCKTMIKSSNFDAHNERN